MASLENFRLVVFRAVAENLSFRRAAEGLSLSQPAVSLQIKALEGDLGVQLFDRSDSQIALTAAGETLLEYARQSSAFLSEAESAVLAQDGRQAGKLSLGASTTIAQYVLPGILGDFRRAYPAIVLTVVSGNTEHIVEAVTKKRIALGLIEGPAQSRAVKTQPFLTDELVLIVPASHPWAKRPSIHSRELASAPLVTREHGSGTRHVVEKTLALHGIKARDLQIAMELDSTEAIKSAVEAGLGVGFISRSAILKDARSGYAFRELSVDGVRIERQFLLAYSSGPEPSGPAFEFRRFLLNRLGSRGQRLRR